MHKLPMLCRCEHLPHQGQCPAIEGCWCDSFDRHGLPVPPPAVKTPLERLQAGEWNWITRPTDCPTCADQTEPGWMPVAPSDKLSLVRPPMFEGDPWTRKCSDCRGTGRTK
jgi:hypothetical protein